MTTEIKTADIKLLQDVIKVLIFENYPIHAAQLQEYLDKLTQNKK